MYVLRDVRHGGDTTLRVERAPIVSDNQGVVVGTEMASGGPSRARSRTYVCGPPSITPLPNFRAERLSRDGSRRRVELRRVVALRRRVNHRHRGKRVSGSLENDLRTNRTVVI